MQKWIVIIGLLLVAFVPIYSLQFVARPGDFDSRWAVNELYGWPFMAYSCWKPDKDSPPESRYFEEWHAANRNLNWAFATFLGLLTFLFLFHLYCRKSLARIGLADIFSLTFAIGVCLAVHRIGPQIFEWMKTHFDLKDEAYGVIQNGLWFQVVMYNYAFLASFGFAQQIQAWINPPAIAGEVDSDDSPPREFDE